MRPDSPFIKLEAYNLARKLVVDCYELTHDLPVEEKTNLGKYIRSAAVTTYISIAQGIFLNKKKKKRKFMDAAKNGLVVIDAALEVLNETGLATEERTGGISKTSSTLFQVLDRFEKK